jgi:hypothetical protein
MTFIEQRETIRHSSEVLSIGEIKTLQDTIVSDGKGSEYRRIDIQVGDESDLDPHRRQMYFEKTNQFEQMYHFRPEWQATYVDDITGELIVDPHNIPAVDLYYKDGERTQMFEWGGQMMQAIALEGLQNLGNGGRFLSAGQLDGRTLERFTFMPDGIGLRSRQHIYSELLVEQAKHTKENSLRIVSLGSGASVPNIEASLKIENQTGKKVDWQLFDIDQRALSYAKGMVDDSPIQLSTFDFGPLSLDPQNPGFAGRSYIEARNQAEDGSLDAVDALGLWEYLTDTQASMFLKMMYTKLKSGAPMIVSNMLSSRPHPLYNERGVGWPRVIKRMGGDMTSIVSKAGISLDNVILRYPSDGVYVVMEVRKP